jgi:hypothetical protein
VNLSDLLIGLRRRWYAVVVGLAITAGLCVGAVKVTPAEYVAQSSVLLLPPASTVGTGGNPYLALGGLQGAADVLARAMSGEAMSSEVTPSNSTATYTFEPDATTNGPMLVIETRDVTDAGALAVLNDLLTRAPDVLKDLQVQVGAPGDSLIRLGTVTRDTAPLTERKAQIRSLIIALVVGIAILLFGTNLLDGYLLRRRARKGEKTTRKARHQQTLMTKKAEDSGAEASTRSAHPETDTKSRPVRTAPDATSHPVTSTADTTSPSEFDVPIGLEESRLLNLHPRSRGMRTPSGTVRSGAGKLD